MTATTILGCGHVPSPCESFTTGYGTDESGARHCYACCAEHDRARMIESGRATLYLTRPNASTDPEPTWKVSNWPDSLSFPARNVCKGSHRCFAGFVRRMDADFDGPDGFVWHAIVRGDMDLARCKRTARKVTP